MLLCTFALVPDSSLKLLVARELLQLLWRLQVLLKGVLSLIQKDLDTNSTPEGLIWVNLHSRLFAEARKNVITF